MREGVILCIMNMYVMYKGFEIKYKKKNADVNTFCLREDGVTSLVC